MIFHSTVRLPGGRWWSDPRFGQEVAEKAAESLKEKLYDIEGVRDVKVGVGLVLVVYCDRIGQRFPKSWSGFTVEVKKWEGSAC